MEKGPPVAGKWAGRHASPFLSTSPVTPASEVAQIGATLPSRTTFWRRPPAHFSPPL